MARKREREQVAMWLSQGLDDGLLAGKLTAEQRDKYNKKIGKALGLPDMIPGRRKPDLHGLKLRIRQRLDRMGVYIPAALAKLRRNKPKKVIAVPKTKPLPLP
jgi:methyl coenzyme M reductase gamma subunit